MARRNFTSTDLWEFMGKAWPTMGLQAVTGASAKIDLSAYPGLYEAGDVVLATLCTCATASYVTKSIVVAGGTRAVIDFSADLGTGTLNYAIFKTNS